MAQPLVAFDNTARNFASASVDSRVKIFDATTGEAKHEFLASGHLHTRIKCVVWALPSTTSGSAKSRRHLLAVGCESGAVDVFDAISGATVATLANSSTVQGHTAAVHDVAFDAAGSSLFSGSADGSVIHWDIASSSVTSKFAADKNGVCRIALDPVNTAWVATASSEIKVWDLASQTVTHRFMGHEATISSLVVSSDGLYLASGSTSGDDRYINLWQIEGAADTLPKAAVRTFVVDSVPLSLDLSRSVPGKKRKKGAATHELVAVAQSGVASVWRFQSGKKPSRGPASQVSLAPAEDVSQASQSLFAAVVSQENTLRLAAGVPSRPWFETVTLVDADSGEPEAEVVVPRRAASSMLSESKGGKTGKVRAPGGESADVAILGPGDVAMSSARDAGNKGRRGKRTELSMGDRAAENSVVMADAPSAPKADSSAVLLTQALQNDDSALLEDCLSCRDHTLITNTVRRLPPTSVLPFLKQVSNRVRSKPGRAGTLVFWIRAVLTEHTAYLTSVPAAAGVLAELFQAADARLDVFDKFLKLQGRLDLIMSHISHRRTGPSGGNGAATFVHRETGDGGDGEDAEGMGGMELDDLDMEDDEEDDESDDDDDVDDLGEGDDDGFDDDDGY